MEINLRNISKPELLSLLIEAQKTISVQDKTISKQDDTISKQDDDLCREREKSVELQRQLELLRRMQFGQKRKRFAAPNGIARGYSASRLMEKHLDHLPLYRQE